VTTDIYGWVETRSPPEVYWDAAIQIRHIVHRQYGMFASLFGVRNTSRTSTSGYIGNGVTTVGRFRAIAPGRGVPEGASEQYAETFDSAGIGATWVLWSELAAIDWEEEGEDYLDEGPPHEVHAEPGPGRRRERRGDYLHGGWVTLFELMRVLAEQFGADNVRLSVWFDE
jgi:hypothetical protein